MCEPGEGSRRSRDRGLKPSIHGSTKSLSMGRIKQNGTSSLPIGVARILGHLHIYASILNGHEFYTLSKTILHKYGTQDGCGVSAGPEQKGRAGVHGYVIVGGCEISLFISRSFFFFAFFFSVEKGAI